MTEGLSVIECCDLFKFPDQNLLRLDVLKECYDHADRAYPNQSYNIHVTNSTKRPIVFSGPIDPADDVKRSFCYANFASYQCKKSKTLFTIDSNGFLSKIFHRYSERLSNSYEYVMKRNALVGQIIKLRNNIKKSNPCIAPELSAMLDLFDEAKIGFFLDNMQKSSSVKILLPILGSYLQQRFSDSSREPEYDHLSPFDFALWVADKCRHFLPVFLVMATFYILFQFQFQAY